MQTSRGHALDTRDEFRRRPFPVSIDHTLAVLRETIPAAPPRARAKSGGGNWFPADLGIGLGLGADPNTWRTLERMLGLTPQNTISLVEAFQIAGVVACSDIIAQDVSKATLRLKKWRRYGVSSEPVDPRDHPVAKWLVKRPHRRFTWRKLTEMAVRWLACTQNAYIVKGIAVDGTPTELIPVMTLRVHKFVDPESGDYWFNVTRGSNFERALLRAYDNRIPEENIIEIRGRMVDGSIGYSKLVLSRSINAYQERLYSSDAREKGVVEMPEGAELSQEAYDRLNRQMKEKWNRARTENEPIVLEGGAKFHSVTMTAADADVAKVRDQQILEVARLFRVPPHKIMHFDTSKYSNLEAQERVYLADTLIPTAAAIEDELKFALLSERDQLKYFFEFDRDEMAAVDSKTRAEIATKAVERTGITLDEFRQMLGADPLPNGAGNVRLLPVNFAVLDENNRVIVQGATRAQVPEGANEPAVPGVDAPAEDDSGKPASGGKIVRFSR
jgi:HK97 family phage portal protein